MAQSASLNAIRSAILRAEAEFPVSNWKFKDIQAWPLVRHKFMMEYLLPRQTKTEKLSLLTRTGLVARGMKELFLLLFFFKTKSFQYIFLTKSTYRVKVNGVWFEKFCDSIIDLVGDDMKDKTCILELGANLVYKKPRYKSARVLEVQGAFYIIGVIATVLFRLAGTRPQLGKFDEFKRFLERETNFTFKLSEKAIAVQLYRIDCLALFLGKVLNPVQLKKLFAVCYYEESGYAAMLMGKRAGVTTVDLQHGVQGEFHFAYMPFRSVPAPGYSLVPSFFWVWNKGSYENILGWNTARHMPFLGGNVWLAKWMSASSPVLTQKPMILVSLQPVEDPLPGELLEAIKLTKGQYAWYLRFHPRQIQEQAILEHLDKEGVREFVNIEQATNLPLPQLLKQAAVHVTLWSSVVIEAFEMGVPSVIIHPTGKMMYSKEEFGSDFIHYAGNKGEICENIGILANKTKVVPGSELLQEQIARFVQE